MTVICRLSLAAASRKDGLQQDQKRKSTNGLVGGSVRQIKDSSCST